jgi:hypothetical protein
MALCFEKIYLEEIRSKEYLLPKRQRKKTSRSGKTISTRAQKRFIVTRKPPAKENKCDIVS